MKGIIKKTFFHGIIGIILFFTACSSNDNKDFKGYHITGTISNAGNSNAYLIEILNKRIQVIDTAILQSDGSFEMKGYVAEKGVYHININNNRTITFVLDNNPIQLKADFVDLSNYQVSGPGNKHQELKEFNKRVNEYTGELNSMPPEFYNIIKNKNEQEQAPIRAQFEKRYRALYLERSAYIRDFVSKNDVMLGYYGANYLDINEEYEFLNEFLKKLTREIPNSKYTHELSKQLNKVSKLIVGAEAPEISLPSPSGEILSLSDLRGKVVLVDFWASWCRPCRMENPNLVSAYLKFNSKGFEIYSVSLDNKKKQWIKAIDLDNLIWKYHVSELSPKRWKEKVVKLYNFNSIPSNYLLDREGRVIAKDLRGESLLKTLTRVFSN